MNNKSPVISKASDNAETFSLSSAKTIRPNNQKNSPVHSKPTTYSAARKKIISPKLASSDKPCSNMTDDLTISSTKKYDNDYATNLNEKNQNSLYCSFVNNHTPTTPFVSHEKNYNSAFTTKPSVHFKPIVDAENLEPITISLTEIENELTGNSIKIRRFFDRQSIRINKININQEKKTFIADKFPKSFSAQSSRKKENKQIYTDKKMEPEIEHFSIKLIPKINRVKSAPIKDFNQTHFLLIPNLEIDPELKESDIEVEESRTVTIAQDSEYLNKNDQEITKNDSSRQYNQNELEIVKNDAANSLPNEHNSVSDKNYISAEYIDNLSISSRVSSVRKNSLGLIYYENSGGKNESESGIYEKLSKADSSQKNKIIEETSLSDYQQILSSRLISDPEISNKEYSSDENKYYDTDLSGKIEAVSEENNEGLAQLLANNFINRPDENYLDHIEKKQISPREINQKEEIEIETNETMVDNVKEEECIQIEHAKLNTNDLNGSFVEIISKEIDKTDLIEQILSPIDKIDSKEEIVSDKIETNLNEQIDDENKLDLIEKIDSIQHENIDDGNSEIKLDDSNKIDIEKNDLIALEKSETDEQNLQKEKEYMIEENSLVNDFVETKIEDQNEQEHHSSEIELIQSNLNKDEMMDFQNSKSDFSNESNTNSQTLNSSYRKISISIVIKQPEMSEDSINKFGTNLISDKSVCDKILPKNEQSDYLENKKLNQHSIESDNLIIPNKNDQLVSLLDEKNKNLEAKESFESQPKKDIIKKKLDEIKIETKSDTKSILSEKQAKKVEFSEHVQEQIITYSKEIKHDSKDEKSRERDFKEPKDLAAKFTTKMNASDEENILKKEKLSKQIIIEDILQEKKPQVESNDKLAKYKTNLSKIDDLLGIKSEYNDQENKNETKKIQKPVKESKFEKKMREKRDRFKNFPYLQLPWDSYEAIIDHDAFKEAFSVPGKIFLIKKNFFSTFY